MQFLDGCWAIGFRDFPGFTCGWGWFIGGWVVVVI